MLLRVTTAPPRSRRRGDLPPSPKLDFPGTHCNRFGDCRHMCSPHTHGVSCLLPLGAQAVRMHSAATLSICSWIQSRITSSVRCAWTWPNSHTTSTVVSIRSRHEHGAGPARCHVPPFSMCYCLFSLLRSVSSCDVGHLYCASCTHQLRDWRCPQCRTALPSVSMLQLNTSAVSHVESLRVRCAEHVRGCDYMGAMGMHDRNMLRHARTCAWGQHGHGAESGAAAGAAAIAAAGGAAAPASAFSTEGELGVRSTASTITRILVS